MIEQLTTIERQRALVLLLVVTLVGLILLIAGKDDPLGVHGALIMVVAIAATFGVITDLFAPEPTENRLESYYDEPSKIGILLAMAWAAVGLFVGAWVAWQLAYPILNFEAAWTSFGRLRPVHTTSVIFGFGGNALIATSFYVMQRTSRARIPDQISPLFVVFGYNLFCLLAVSGYMLGVTQSNTVIYLWDWAPNGKFLIYSTPYSKTNDLYLVPLDGKREPVQLTNTPAEDQFGQVSPDSRWLAYSASERGRMQIYVQPIPSTGALRLVSKDGGSMPRWRADGKELFYRGADGQLMVVPIQTGSDPAAAFEHGPPQPLFGPIPTVGNLPRFTYQPSTDGQRFLVAAPVASATPPITVVLNWQPAIRK